MFTKFIAFVLMFFLALGTSPIFAGGGGDKKSAKREAKLKKHGNKIRNGIKKLGVGQESVVVVKLRNKTKIKGFVSEINEDTFSVTDSSRIVHVIEYPNAKQVKGRNISNGAWVAIGFGLAMAVFGIALLYAISKNN